MKKIEISKGDITCLVAAFMLTFLIGQIVGLFTGDRLNIVAFSAMISLIGWYAINKGIEKGLGLSFKANRESGYLGLMLAEMLTLILF